MHKLDITDICKCKSLRLHNHDWEDISVESAIDINKKDPIALFASFGITEQGTLQAVRTVLLETEHICVVLDKNSYLGIVDYELEIEYEINHNEIAEKTLICFYDPLYNNGLTDNVDGFIARVNTGKRKSQRFFDQKALM